MMLPQGVNVFSKINNQEITYGILILCARAVRRISNYFRFGISDFGNKVKYLCFLQNIKDYTSEIQHPISKINSFYNPSYSTNSVLIIHNLY
jgi:response regulator of citrate/malate metabolism